MNKIVKYVASWEKDQSTIWLILSLFKKISRFTFPLFFSSCEKLAFLTDLVRWDIPRWRAGKAYVNETMLATTSILPFSLLLSFFSPSFPCHFPSAIFFCTFITFTYFSFHYFVLLLFFSPLQSASISFELGSSLNFTIDNRFNRSWRIFCLRCWLLSNARVDHYLLALVIKARDKQVKSGIDLL